MYNASSAAVDMQQNFAKTPLAAHINCRLGEAMIRCARGPGNWCFLAMPPPARRSARAPPPPATAGESLLPKPDPIQPYPASPRPSAGSLPHAGRRHGASPRAGRAGRCCRGRDP
ncbi:hypothetical protein PVAP13_3KG264506 [Panicum virgatum]|uniref:Uncharacterized protein n=1 Tax=Panicum virgatum TaxID=38727 RepID=A0A8T0V2Z0_PANVG|nr:hypothetical protein PVAP13_3KG264506 [Panicum virgatum]